MTTRSLRRLSSANTKASNRKQRRPSQFKPGTSGHPQGRPPGIPQSRFERTAGKLYDAKVSVEKLFADIDARAVAAAARRLAREEKRGCSVCAHVHRPVIDGLLTLHVPVRALARAVGLSHQTLLRHSASHLPRFTGADHANELAACEQRLRGILWHLKTSGYREGAETAMQALWQLTLSTAADTACDRLRICTIAALLELATVPVPGYFDVQDARALGCRKVSAAVDLLESWFAGSRTPAGTNARSDPPGIRPPGRPTGPALHGLELLAKPAGGAA